MKTAAKVFIIIGMVCEFYLILPLIFGGITLSKMKTARCKDDMIVWGVLDIFFVNVLSGIFVLLTKDEDYYENFAPYPPQYGANNAIPPAQNTNSDGQNGGDSRN